MIAEEVRRLRVSNEMILRKIAGENILIPTGQTALKVHGIISLSESGLLLWEKLHKDCTEADLIDAILAEYEIDWETATEDVQTFIGKLREVGVLIEDNI